MADDEPKTAAENAGLQRLADAERDELIGLLAQFPDAKECVLRRLKKGDPILRARVRLDTASGASRTVVVGHELPKWLKKTLAALRARHIIEGSYGGES